MVKVIILYASVNPTYYDVKALTIGVKGASLNPI